MTDEEYNDLLTRIEGLMDAERGTTEGEELDRLVKLIQDYEDQLVV